MAATWPASSTLLHRPACKSPVGGLVSDLCRRKTFRCNAWTVADVPAKCLSCLVPQPMLGAEKSVENNRVAMAFVILVWKVFRSLSLGVGAWCTVLDRPRSFLHPERCQPVRLRLGGGFKLWRGLENLQKGCGWLHEGRVAYFRVPKRKFGRTNWKELKDKWLLGKEAYLFYTTLLYVSFFFNPPLWKRLTMKESQKREHLHDIVVQEDFLLLQLGLR